MSYIYRNWALSYPTYRKNDNTFSLKITLIFFGGTGTIISFILSGINHKTILEAIKEKTKPLDLIFGYGENIVHLVSQFGLGFFF